MSEPSPLEVIFFAALAKAPGECAAFLIEACAGDENLRSRVQRMLAAQADAGSFLETPAVPIEVSATTERPLERPGTQIGPYKLLQQVGEGGMGVVYMAEQLEPVKRRVALKIIKPGMDTRQVIARFGAERQALSLMDHPNIAKVLDAGTTESGRPYFVMELVKGQAITQYCDEHHLTPRQRLELLLPVCQAIQHAHQKGIIHRDIKPTNILVAEYDNRPVPKVIDFGVAKAISQSLTEKTMFTGLGQIVGTLEYMSPEQAKVNQLDIDTRSDIYSLGVLLYELLTGSTPFDKQRLRSAAFDEMLRIIREEEPPKPSTRLSDSHDSLPSISAQRHTEPAKLTKLVRGELDWIVMKALDKDRNRRFETANAFAADIEHYLNDEPVQACPPSAWYRFRKFARRNKRAVATMTTLALATLLAVGSLAASISWVVHDRQSRQTVLEHQVMLALSDVAAWHRQSNWPEALAAVKRAEGLLDSGSKNSELKSRVWQWQVDLETVTTLDEIRLLQAEMKGDLYDPLRADPAYEAAFHAYGIDVLKLDPAAAARRIRESAIAEQLIVALDDWCWIKRLEQGPAREHLRAVARVADLDPWRNTFRDPPVSGRRAKLDELVSRPETDLLPPTSTVLLARALVEAGARPKAIEVLRAAQRRHPGDFWLNYETGNFYFWSNQFGDAANFFQAAQAIRPDNPRLHVFLAETLGKQGRFAESLPYLQRAVELKPDYIWAHVNLGNVLARLKKWDAAFAAHGKALALGPDDPWVVANTANIRRQKGDLDQAVDLYERAIRLGPRFAEFQRELGWTWEKKGDLAKAEKALRAAVKLDKTNADCFVDLGRVLEGRTSADEAIAAYREGFRLRPSNPSLLLAFAKSLTAKKDYGAAIRCVQAIIEVDPKNAAAHRQLGHLFSDQHRTDEAIAAFREATRLQGSQSTSLFELAKSLLAQNDIPGVIRCYRALIEVSPGDAKAHEALGNALLDNRQIDEAIAAYRETTRLKPDSANAYYNLGRALRMNGEVELAIAAYEKALDLEPGHAYSLNNLGNLFRERKEFDRAIALYQKAIDRNPNIYQPWWNLGRMLVAKGELDQAITAFERASRLNPSGANIYFDLGQALRAKKRPRQALLALQMALHFEPKSLAAHLALGNLFLDLRRHEEAIAEYRAALRLEPDSAEAYSSLGTGLRATGQLAEAIDAQLQAIQLKPGLAPAHYNLGNALREAGELQGDRAKLAEAIAEFREAIRLQPDYAEAHWNLGQTLQRQGELTSALAALRRGHELGAKVPGWRPEANAQGLQDCERLLELDAKLPKILTGELPVADAAESLALAQLCALGNNRPSAAVRFYTQAFAADPKLADNPRSVHRYNAACAAALAGCGQGKDADQLEDTQRARLRQQALDWLRADLTAWQQTCEREADKAIAVLQRTLRYWQNDHDLACVRGAEALASLPGAERRPWQQLWDDAEELIQRTANQKK